MLFFGLGVLGFTFLGGCLVESSCCCVEPRSVRVSPCLGLAVLIESPGLLFNLISVVGDRPSFFPLASNS